MQALVWATERLNSWASGVSQVLCKDDPTAYAHTSGASSIRPH